MLTEYRADRLDTPPQATINTVVLVAADERDHLVWGRSSSAAKKADATFKISLARRSSAASRFSRLISACSADAVPGRCPAPASARRTHLHSVSALPIPSFLATAVIAAYCEG